MLENFMSFLFYFDLIGKSPQLLIFKKKTNKSILSSLISIIIIISAICFAIYSLIEYSKYDQPNIVYSKGNDQETKQSFFKKDFVLMFQLIDTTTIKNINNSVAYYVADYIIYYNNGTNIYIPLDIETCEIGKNIDMKYKDFVNDTSNYGRKVEEFSCLNSKHENISLFYDPKLGFSSISLYVIFENNTVYTPEKIQSIVVTENNIINHYNKSNPISNGYIFQFTSAYSSFEYTKVSYNLQYIKYDTDEGFFFPNFKSLYGMSFSDMTSYRTRQNNHDLIKNFEEISNSAIGTIEIEINKSNFDNYKRNYKKLQALLAEIMSVVNLLFQVGTKIMNILGDKKMSIDIIDNLLNKKSLKKLSYQKHDINKIIKKADKKQESTERKIKQESVDKTIIIENISKNEDKLDKTNNRLTSSIKKIEKTEENKQVLKKINYFPIIKSFLCFEDNKTKLINLCHNIISEDISIERILERFYNLENIHQIISKEEKEKLKNYKNKRFKEIYININKIEKEFEKDKSIKNESVEKTKKENNTIKLNNT